MAALVQASDGNLYGTTLRGGANDKGTVFRIALDGTLTQIHEFTGDDGENPEGTLIVGSDGNLYGTTLQGGKDSRGTIFRVTLAGARDLAVFLPVAERVQHRRRRDQRHRRQSARRPVSGSRWQFLRHGLPGRPRWLRHGVSRYARDGSRDRGPRIHRTHCRAAHSRWRRLSQDAAGNLYGTTERGGAINQGTAWRIDTSGQFSLLHGFIGTIVDGSTPYATLLPLNGYLYGVTLHRLERPGSAPCSSWTWAMA